MPNHVHLILVPPAEEALCRCVGETHRRYSRRVNFREGWRGHLWQSRFASYPMDDAYTLTAAAYAERNPVKAALVAEQVGRALPAAGARQDRWRAQPALLAAAQLRRHENTVRPLGSEHFVKRLERSLARRLTPGRPGRPRKDGTGSAAQKETV